MKRYIREIADMPGAVLRFLLTEALLCIGLGAWNLSVNFLLQFKGLGGGEIGSVMAAGPLVTAVLAVFLGPACDRLGYRRSLALGCGMKALAVAAVFASPPGSALYFARALNGAGDCFLLISEFPYITSLVQGEAKNLVYNLMFGTTAFSSFLGNSLGGLVLDLLGTAQALPVAAACGVLAASAAAVLRLRLPEISVHGAERFHIYKPEKRSIGLYMLFEFIGYGGYAVAYSMLNLFCRDTLHLSMGATGLVIGTMTVASSMAVFLCHPLAARFGRGRSAFTVLCALAALYFVMGFSGWFLFVSLVVVTAMLQFMVAGLLDAQMLGRVTDSKKSAYMGMRLTLNNIGTSGGTYAAGALLGLPNPGVIYVIVGASVVVQIVLYAVGFRREMGDGERTVVARPAGDAEI